MIIAYHSNNRIQRSPIRGRKFIQIYPMIEIWTEVIFLTYLPLLICQVLIRSCIVIGESSFSGYNYSDISVVVRIHSDITISAGYLFASIKLSMRVVHSNAALRFHV